jgi:hypothetical protein
MAQFGLVRPGVLAEVMPCLAASAVGMHRVQHCEPEWDGDRRVARRPVRGWQGPACPVTERNSLMAIILLVLLLAIILGGLGFAIHVLWWIALAVLVLWLIGFLVRVGEGTSRSRWYRW